MAYLFGGQLLEAENIFQSALNFYGKRGLEQFSVLSQCFLSPILIAKGHMQQGTELLEIARKTMIRNQRRVLYAMSEYILGEVNSQIATVPRPSLSIMFKNIGFLVKNVPFATKNLPCGLGAQFASNRHVNFKERPNHSRKRRAQSKQWFPAFSNYHLKPATILERL